MTIKELKGHFFYNEKSPFQHIANIKNRIPGGNINLDIIVTWQILLFALSYL